MTGEAPLDRSKISTIEKAVFRTFWDLFSSKSSSCKAEKEPAGFSLSLSPSPPHPHGAGIKLKACCTQASTL